MCQCLIEVCGPFGLPPPASGSMEISNHFFRTRTSVNAQKLKIKCQSVCACLLEPRSETHCRQSMFKIQLRDSTPLPPPLTIISTSKYTAMATGHLLGQLLPLRSIQLGRLVLNATCPSQDFIDPPSGGHIPHKIRQNVQTNYTETRRFLKGSKVRPHLTGIISFSDGQQNKCIATLRMPQATTYDLTNSASWFEDTCAQVVVRCFLDRAIDNGRDVYLVVGFRTMGGEKLVKDFAASSRGAAARKTPIHAATSTRITSPGTNTGPGISALGGHGSGQELVYRAPEEQVFAVLYRKVKFRFLTRKAVDTTVLEANNR